MTLCLPCAFSCASFPATNLLPLLPPPAHKLYPLRVRVVNVVTGEVEWEPIAYIPLVRKQKEPSAEMRGRERRSAVLQRVLYLAFRTTITASHIGVLHEHDGKSYVAFPRLLLYMSDQPEEKAVLCLKGGSCQHPCSTCVVHVKEAGAPAALSAKERDAVLTVERQLEGAAHKRYQRQSVRRTELEAMESAHNRVPVLAGMAGMTTAPFLLYKSIGFDALHVSEAWSDLCLFLRLCWYLYLGVCMSGLMGARGLLVAMNPSNGETVSSRVPVDLCLVIALQVLDMGVTRLLVHRLVRVFPYICEGYYPLCETIDATLRVANVRIEFMGRRSRASRVPPG